MKKHKDQFDEKLSKLARNEACGLPLKAGLGKGKINHGRSGAGSQTLSSQLQDEIRAKWKEVVEPATGATSYTELRENFHRESERMYHY